MAKWNSVEWNGTHAVDRNNGVEWYGTERNNLSQGVGMSGEVWNGEWNGNTQWNGTNLKGM